MTVVVFVATALLLHRPFVSSCLRSNATSLRLLDSQPLYRRLAGHSTSSHNGGNTLDSPKGEGQLSPLIQEYLDAAADSITAQGGKVTEECSLLYGRSLLRGWLQAQPVHHCAPGGSSGDIRSGSEAAASSQGDRATAAGGEEGTVVACISPWCEILGACHRYLLLSRLMQTTASSHLVPRTSQDSGWCTIPGEAALHASTDVTVTCSTWSYPHLHFNSLPCSIQTCSLSPICCIMNVILMYAPLFTSALDQPCWIVVGNIATALSSPQVASTDGRGSQAV